MVREIVTKTHSLASYRLFYRLRPLIGSEASWSDAPAEKAMFPVSLKLPPADRKHNGGASLRF